LTAQKKDTLQSLPERLREEVIPLLKKALANGASLYFENPHVACCWKITDCKSDACSLYGRETKGVRCWQIAGSYCGGEFQCPLAESIGNCSDCKVFKASCPTLAEEIGEHLNNILFLFNKQRSRLLEDKTHIEHLKRELESALEQIDIKNREIQKMMITDKLTGLFNRHHLITVLQDEIARCHRYGHPLAIMMIDIDDFKSINDNYGRSAGDTMLEYVGTLIKENTRKFDRSFRYGGEEFIVVLPETDITLAYIVAERVRKGFEAKSFTVSCDAGTPGKNISRTLSIGITATFPYKTTNIDIEELLNQSDKALYLAKNKGGNTSVRFE